MKKILSLTALITLLGGGAFANLRVVATVPNMGMLAREIGGDAVSVRVMAPPDRDAHYLEARPSMMAALRRADIVVAVGGELEIGWLPAAIRGANNSRVQRGQPGNFEASDHVELIGAPSALDRSMGDVHPHGNPHVYLDPERLIAVGHALADRLAEIDRGNAELYLDNAEQLEREIGERVEKWRSQIDREIGVLLYHEDLDYLLNMLDVRVLGHIEPLPGIPPTARHLRDLTSRLADIDGVVWTVDYQPEQGGYQVASQLGWDFHHLPAQVSMRGSLADYLEMIDNWVQTIALRD